ncbi:hypothetical protein HPB52_021993 [Rhipicephalus sanguineus]|uniref:Uncharacterized protein n=1 Tax=Rhipicephalus sanguineus TaxID=34632 RepID=A0A9D4Q8F2_RHISA|nr:hypothetical protein HPB52_021993 [Rhipicephalus sanguineus]
MDFADIIKPEFSLAVRWGSPNSPFAQTCEFGAFLDESLRDRSVCGLLRVDIQAHLFSDDKQLTFQRAVDRATALEAALVNATATHSKPGSVFEVHQLPTKESTKCSRCN